MALYFRSVGTAWNSNTSWSTTSSSGGSAGVIPTATDDVILDSGSASCPVSTTTGVCKTLTTTGYTNTLTLTVGINIFGNITIGAGTLWSGAGTLSCHADTGTRLATITSNANIIGVPFQFFSDTANCTFTLSGDLTVNALVSTSASTTGLTTTINGNNVFCKTSFTMNLTNSTSSTTTGTTVIQLIGTGSLSSGGGTLQNNLIINTSGTIAWVGTANVITYNTGTFTYIAGTITGNANSTLALTSASTLDWNNGGLNTIIPVKIAFNSSSTTTLISNAYTSLGVSNANSANCTVNGFNIYIYGGTLQYFNMAGSTNYFIKGTCTMSSSSTTLTNNVIFDAGASTITLGANSYSTGTITYTSGVINNTGTLTITSGVTFNTVGMSFGTITIGSGTITLNSLLTASTINISASNLTITFAGIAGFTISNWNMPGFNTTVILKIGITYNILSSMSILTTTIASPHIIKSGTPGTRATLILANGATQSNHYIIATDIDSSAGQTIWVWQPTLSNTLNWKTLTTPATVVSTF